LNKSNYFVPETYKTYTTFLLQHTPPTPKKRPNSSDQKKSINPEVLNTTAINYKNSPIIPTKPKHTTNKQARSTPYNTRHTKKPIISIQDKPSLKNPSSFYPSYHERKKRSSSYELVSPPKKGLGVSEESAEPPDLTPSNILVYSPGYSKKTLAKALFKAARKGKKQTNWVLLFLSLKSHLRKRGALSSLPSNNENSILELQGTIQACCNSNTEEIDLGSIS
jgi:hypothetical protein